MTELFPPENYAGTIGQALDPNAVAGSAGSLSSGAGTATYQDFGDGTTWARYLGQKALFRDSLTLFPQHFWWVFTFALDHTPSAGFESHILLNAVSGNNIASITAGSAGSLTIQGADGHNVDSSRPRYDFRTGLYVGVWEIDGVNGVQTLTIYSTTGLLIDKLTGACGTEKVTRSREGVNTNVVDAQFFCRTAGITDAFVPPVFGMSSLWTCNALPKPTELDVTVVTTGATAVRLYLPDLGVTTAEQTPDVTYGLTYHTVTGLSPRTRYAYNVQGFLNGIWTTLDSGSNKTAPDAASGQSVRIGSVGCTANSSTLTYAFDAAIAADLDWLWHEGDWDYFDDESSDPGVYFWDYVNQAANTPGLAAIIRHYGVFPTPSDHIWDNNANTGGMQSTLAHDTAWRLLWPQYASPLAGEQGLCFAYDYAGIRSVFWDFRNYYRWNSDDPLVPYNSPQRIACGPQQMAWLEQQITDPAPRFTILHSDPVPLSNPPHTPPYPPELLNKTDALPSYTVFRGRLFSWLAAKVNSLFFFGDYHSVSACSRSFSPLAGVAIFGAAGTDQTFTYRNKADINTPIIGVYEQYWPPETANENTPIAVWGQVDLVADGATLTVNCTGWDCLTTPGTPIARVQLSETFVTGFESFTLAGTVLDPVTGQPANGFLTLTPCDGNGAMVSPIIDTGGATVLAAAQTRVEFTDGQVSIPGLPNPSDSNLNPSGFGYLLQITTDAAGPLGQVIFTVEPGVDFVDISAVQPGSPDIVTIPAPPGFVLEVSTTAPTDTSHLWVDLTS